MKTSIKKSHALFLSIFSLFAIDLVASDEVDENPPQSTSRSEGWSMDVGGQYTWMSFSTPPTFKGSTGGVQGKITYQKGNAFFGQARSIYNMGSLSSHGRSSREREWYTEFVGGYCFAFGPHWNLTPYAGFGVDALNDHKRSSSSFTDIRLRYRLYYALAGVDVHYTWDDWSVGTQIDCFPTFNQYLSISGEPGAAWKLRQRVGAAARLPVAYQIAQGIWIELAPYYRFVPIGSSHTLGLPHRNLNQWGGFLTFRFFL